MATKINETFYGAEANFISVSSHVKKSPYTLPTIVTSGNYTGGSLDYSAAPWGIGESSASNNFALTVGKGASWTINTNTRTAKNTPLFLYSVLGTQDGAFNNAGLVGADESSYNYELALFRSRIDPDVKLNQYNRFLSSLTIDSGSSVTFADSYNTYPITYMDYQSVKIVVGHVYYKPDGEDTVKKTTLDAIINNSVSVDKIVYFDVSLYDEGNYTNTNLSIGGNALDLLDIYKSVYYEDISTITSPARKIGRFGYWYIDEHFYNEDGFRYSNSEYADYQSEWETLGNSSFVYPRPAFAGWSTMSDKIQAFSDVSYHWEYGISPYDNNQWHINKISTGDAYVSGVYMSFAYMELDEYDGLTKNEAYASAILHELAFLGLPIVASTSHLSAVIGDIDMYLPEFDEHLITTGNYLSGSDSLNLPNATWTDIFSDTMPAYDPEYEPEPPEPGEDDQGDLTNSYTNRFTNAGGLAQWVVSQSQLLQLAGFLNGSYLPSSADLDADFKGTNPMDYIVSVQKYPFTLPNVGTSSDIYIGHNNTAIQGKKLFPDYGGLSPIPINSASSYDFGSISVPYYYNDFRDYQSKIYLFMPFIGTDELDPRLYIGHSLSLIYRVDYNTGSVVAEIKRDGLTMETKNSTISITVPFLAANMGAYQNQLAQLSYSKDMTKIKGIGTALSAGFTMAAGASGALSTGQPSLAAGSNLAQAAVSLAANATQLNYIDYQIEHTAPQIGTISTAGAGTAFFMDDRARIVIMRPKMLAGYSAQQYSRTIGNACCKTGKLSEFSGYTQAATAILDNVHTKHTSRQATEQEKQLLRKTLQNGIYL